MRRAEWGTRLVSVFGAAASRVDPLCDVLHSRGDLLDGASRLSSDSAQLVRGADESAGGFLHLVHERPQIGVHASERVTESVALGFRLDARGEVALTNPVGDRGHFALVLDDFAQRLSHAAE